MFLAEMDAVVPWARPLSLIAPHYPKTARKGGRLPIPPETMLLVYFLHNWCAFSDPMRRFAGIELGDGRIPDETTILNFRQGVDKTWGSSSLHVSHDGMQHFVRSIGIDNPRCKVILTAYAVYSGSLC